MFEKKEEEKTKHQKLKYLLFSKTGISSSASRPVLYWQFPILETEHHARPRKKQEEKTHAPKGKHIETASSLSPKGKKEEEMQKERKKEKKKRKEKKGSP